MRERRWRETLLGAHFMDHHRTPEATANYIIRSYDILARLPCAEVAMPSAGAAYMYSFCLPLHHAFFSSIQCIISFSCHRSGAALYMQIPSSERHS